MRMISVDEYHIPISYIVIRDMSVIRTAPANDAFDEDSLRFHVESGDYFGVLAAALGFIEEKLEACTACEGDATSQSPELLSVRRLRAEAQYLHTHYDICAKSVHEHIISPFI